MSPMTLKRKRVASFPALGNEDSRGQPTATPGTQPETANKKSKSDRECVERPPNTNHEAVAAESIVDKSAGHAASSTCNPIIVNKHDDNIFEGAASPADSVQTLDAYLMVKDTDFRSFRIHPDLARLLQMAIGTQMIPRITDTSRLLHRGACAISWMLSFGP